jgi:hypothetical protein
VEELLEDRQRPCAAEGGGLEDAEAELTLLTDFLEGHDFRRLRADQPDLAGGHALTVELHRTPEGRATFRRV